MLKNISILGSTGSIGVNTLEVVRSHPDKFKVIALSCGKNLEKVKEQILEFKPLLVSVQKEQDAETLKNSFSSKNIPKIVFGENGNIEVATHPQTNLVVSAIVGAIGLVPTLRAIQAKKAIALANKETMVVAGELMNLAAKEAQVDIFPVDSEHNAIFQCLIGHKKEEVKRLILTASGGPFLHLSKKELEKVTLEQALRHPKWKMGAKITIDSATLMNKGLEVIEARWLFNIPENQIDVHIHPQSVIHSMVEYYDGSVIAQLGIPDMQIPIAYALSYPNRLPNRLPSLDLCQVRDLNFYPPDLEKFECLALAKQALTLGGEAPCLLNAANEVVVQAYLDQQIHFLDIPRIVRKVLLEHPTKQITSLEQLLETDRFARMRAAEMIQEQKANSVSKTTYSHLSSEASQT